MNARKQKLKLVMDEGVPNSVGAVFKKNGHDVIYINQDMLVMRGSPDKLVATAAIANNAILVALDGDMKQLAKTKLGVSNKRFKKLNLIKLSCIEPEAAGRVESLMSLIEHEWDAGAAHVDRRIYIEILPSLVRSMR